MNFNRAKFTIQCTASGIILKKVTKNLLKFLHALSRRKEKKG